MNWRLFIWRTFFYYRRSLLGTLLGCAIGTAVITGALLVGDSVQYSLNQLTEVRLGRTEFAMATGEGFFRARLADELQSSLAADVAPVIELSGMAIGDGGRRRINQIQVLGVDDRFWRLGRGPQLKPLEDGEAMVNQRLAERLKLRPGDEIVVRIAKPGVLAREAAFSPKDEDTVAFRVRVGTILTATHSLMNFNRKIHQSAPDNLFLPLEGLAEQIGRTGRANLLLAAGQPGKDINPAKLTQALNKSWTLGDANLELRTDRDLKYLELRSDQVFLGEKTVKAAFQADPDAQGVFAYFVNQIKAGNFSAPYSVVAAVGPPLVPEDMGDNELIANQWLAEDLKLRPGDSIELKYYIIGPFRELVEKEAVFRVHSVIPISGLAADPKLMPDFPGLAGLHNCRDWNPGIPIQLDRIRKLDERYWELYRGTPKAFISLKTAQKIWGNPFGKLTAVRYPFTRRTDGGNLESRLNQRLIPAALGFYFRPVREEGMKAGAGTVDFGQLFLGLSMFLLIAALLLTGLLFHFRIESRAKEIGILKALGYSSFQVGRLILVEGLGIAFLGSLFGACLGIGYNQLILWALKTIWYGAAGFNSGLSFHLKMATLVTGIAAGIGAALSAIFIATWIQVKKLPVAGVQSYPQRVGILGRLPRRRRMALLIGVGVLIPPLLIWGRFQGNESATIAFMTTGFLLLIGGLTASDLWLEKLLGANSAKISIPSVGARNSLRRRGRTLTIIGLLSAGIFLVVAIAVNRRDLVSNANQRASGTGGFALVGETTVPLVYDLNRPDIKHLYGLDRAPYDRANFVQLRVSEGDDASCLNLNHIQRPRILGVNGAEFIKRGSFSFVKTLPGIDPRNPWTALNQDLGPDVIPAIADYTTIVWGLEKALGDTLMITDESGQRIQLKLVAGLANSVFQGNLLISETSFRKLFPGVNGAKLILADQPPGLQPLRHAQQPQQPMEGQKAFAILLAESLEDFGIEITSAAERLEQFETVENTYLSIFLILGGLGVILGAGGIGIVLLKNTEERWGELTLLRAVGFTPGALLRMLGSENWPLLLYGVLVGSVAGLVAAFPSLAIPGMRLPWISMVTILAGIILLGAGWILLAAKLAVRGQALAGLREE